MHPTRRFRNRIWKFSAVLLAQLASHFAPAAETSVEVNKGTSDRSRVREITVQLPAGQTLVPSSLRIQTQASQDLLSPGAFTLSADASRYTLRFPNLPGGALADGNYLLSLLTVPEGGGAVRSQQTFPFYAWFGDQDGDRDVDYLDTSFLWKTWNLSTSAAGFDARFDFNADGSVNASDLSPLQSNYFRILPPAASVSAYLATDDGGSNTDSVTSDPTIRGTLNLAPAGTAFSLRGDVRSASAATPNPATPFPGNLAGDMVTPNSFALAEARLQALGGSALQPGTPYLFRAQLVAANNTVVARDAVPFTIALGRGNLPPQIVPPGNRVIPPATAFSTTIFAIDPDAADTLTFSVASGPEGLTIDPATGQLDWPSPLLSSQPYIINLRVQDQNGAADTTSLTIFVEQPENVGLAGRSPTITVPADASLLVGATFSAAATATDPDSGDTLTYSLPQAPVGMMINPATGSISWVPAQNQTGPQEITARVTDRSGLSDFGSFVVTPSLPNRGPVAVDDIFTTPKGVTTTFPARGVLTNDTDPDNSPLTAQLVSEPLNGTLNFRPDGSFDYTPGTGTSAIQARLAYSIDRITSFGTTGRINVKDYSATTTVNRAVCSDLDGDGKPEVIVVFQKAAGIGNTGHLVALKLNEATGQFSPLWTFKAAAGEQGSIYDSREVAVGDVTGDGIPEVIVGGQCSGEVLIFSNTGQLLVSTQADKYLPNGVLGSENCYSIGIQHPPSLADLDGDGLAEIINPAKGKYLRAMNGLGEILWETELPRDLGGARIGGVLVADFDLDGAQEIYFAGTFFDAKGKILRTVPDSARLPEKVLAMANLDDDPYAEIVIFTDRYLRVVNHDGTCKWVASNRNFSPTGSGCGTALPFPLPSEAPFAVGMVVADLNGDGLPEIVVSTGSDGFTGSVTVFNRDGRVLWQIEPMVGNNPDGRPNITAFDFNGDGQMEIVASGLFGTVFLAGADGSKLFEIPPDAKNPGGSFYTPSTPIVVDMEADGHAELVLTSTSSTTTLPTGIFVYKDTNDRWMPTRSVWNQFSLSITNVNEDGSIPRKPAINWLTPGLNNFAVNLPSPDEARSSDSFTYRVSDGALTSNVARVTLEVRKPNRPPIFLSTPRTAAVPGFAYRYNVFATDPDIGDLVTLSLLKGPLGLTLGAGNVVRWMPTQANLGETAVTLAATDREGLVTLQNFTLRVISAQLVPDVVGNTEANALTILDNTGFVGGRITREDHPTTPAGSVIRQLPLAGASELPGTAVALVISNGLGIGNTDGDGDGFTPNQGDCDDSSATISPNANDPAGDGIDQNCDGIDGALTLASIVVEPANPRALTNQNIPLKATGIFTDGTSQDLSAVVIWTSGGPRFSSAVPGNFPVSASRGAIVGNTTATIVGQIADAAPPLAEITGPASGGTVTEPVNVLGSAVDPNFLKYELAYAPAGTENFTIFASGNNPVTNATLGKFDPTLLLNDQYTIRLTVFDQGRNRTTAETTVLVEGDLKVGNFSLSFTDLNIPMAGIPIGLIRTYDSRDKTGGDFGVGWKLGIQSTKITSNRIPGTGWKVDRAGLAFALQESDKHIFTVSHSDGNLETFDLVISPNVSPLVPFPVSVLRASFKARPGTLGKLESLANNTLSIFDAQPGPVQLLDDVTLATYNPRRFRYTDPDGYIMILDVDRGLESITDLNGNSLQFNRDGIIHSSGRSIVFTRDARDRIVKTQDPNGATLEYGYDANGDLRTYRDPLGNITRLAYNRTHGLIRIEDPTGNMGIRTEYDDEGRLIATIDATGNRTEFTRDMAAREESVRDAQGNLQRLRYDRDGNVISSERTVTSESAPVLVRELFEYDEQGNQTSLVDADGVRSTFQYDSKNRLIRTVVDPAGNAIVSSTSYDAEGNVVAEIDPLGNSTQFTYGNRRNIATLTNPAGATNRFDFDSKGQAVSSTDIFGVRTAVIFDSSGRPIQQDAFEPDSSLLSRVRYTYDANGRELTRTTFQTRNRVLAPLTTTYAYDAMGRRISTTDPEGGITRTEYDSRGLAVAEINALGRRTEYRFDIRGQLVETRLPDGATNQVNYDFKGHPLTTTDASGRVTRYKYDELGREISVTQPDGSELKNVWSPGGRLVASIDALGNRTDFDYDSAGRKIRTRSPQVTDARTGNTIRPTTSVRLNAAGQPIGITDANGNETGFTLNSLGKVLRTVNPDGTSKDTTYDVGGRVLSTTDELGHVTRFAYDGLSRLREVEQPRSNPATAPSITKYTYDLGGPQTSRIDALGNTTRYDYDKIGRRVRRTLPSGLSETAEFDVIGNQIRHTAFDGKVSTISYDNRNRGVLAIDGDGVESRIEYAENGLRKSISDSTGTINYSYDIMDRVASVTSPTGEEVAFTYDENGNRKSVTSPAGSTTYAYDGLNRLIRVDSASGITLQGYDPNGNEMSILRPDGTKTARTVDSRNRVVSVEHRTAANNVLASFNSTYAANGRRLSVAEADGSLESYSYDGMGRLVSEQRTGTTPRSLTYQYDAVGNRIARTRNGITETYSYGADYELLKAGNHSFTYDANGNRTSSNIGSAQTLYRWNARNRLTSAKVAALNNNYTYDADGSRIRSEKAGSTRDFLVDTVTPDNLARVLEEKDQAGQTLATFNYGNSLLSVNRDGVRQILTDAHGSTRLTTTAGGIAANPLTYEAFGKSTSGDPSTESGYLFAGEQFDPATGLYYLRERYYDPDTGVFLSRDSSEGSDAYPATQNPYTFASNDPVNLIDPSGQFSVAELSISNSIQNSLNALKLTLNYCNSIGRAKSVAGAVSFVTTLLAGQSLGFDGNTFERVFENEPPTNFYGSKLKSLTIEAKFKDLARDKPSFSASAAVAFLDSSAAFKLGVEISSDGFKPEFGIAFGAERELFDIKACNTIPYLTVSAGLEGYGGEIYAADTGAGSKISAKAFFKIKSIIGINTEVPFIGVEGILGYKKFAGTATLLGNYQIAF